MVLICSCDLSRRCRGASPNFNVDGTGLAYQTRATSVSLRDNASCPFRKASVACVNTADLAGNASGAALERGSRGCVRAQTGGVIGNAGRASELHAGQTQRLASTCYARP
jgi:hypothetical protein